MSTECLWNLLFVSNARENNWNQTKHTAQKTSFLNVGCESCGKIQMLKKLSYNWFI